MVIQQSFCNIQNLVFGSVTSKKEFVDESFALCHAPFTPFRSYETKKKGVGKVEEKQAILHEEGKMDDGLDFSRSQEEESKTARVIRKCSSLFTKFIK